MIQLGIAIERSDKREQQRVYTQYHRVGVSTPPQCSGFLQH